MGKKAFIAAIMVSLFLVSIFVGMKAAEIAKANPLIQQTPSQDINWVYLTTITGNSSQTVTILMPNLSHWCVTGNYVASAGETFFNVSSYAGYFWDHPFGLLASQSFPVTFEHHNETEQGQGNITLEIAVTNVLSYTLIVEYAPNDSSPIQQPTISILSPENSSTFISAGPRVSFPLIYETNSTLSWVGYSIDGFSNVTISPNDTITELYDAGSHNLTLYANDTFGNWAIPQTVNYAVAINLGTAPTPSPSPSQQPTIAPSATPSNTQENFTPALIMAALVVAVVVVALVVYSRRTKKQNP